MQMKVGRRDEARSGRSGSSTAAACCSTTLSPSGADLPRTKGGLQEMNAKLAAQVAEKLLNEKGLRPQSGLERVEIKHDIDNEEGKPWDVFIDGSYLNSEDIEAVQRIVKEIPGLAYRIYDSKVQIYEMR
jgi:hypothetical protein